MIDKIAYAVFTFLVTLFLATILIVIMLVRHDDTVSKLNNRIQALEHCEEKYQNERRIVSVLLKTRSDLIDILTKHRIFVMLIESGGALELAPPEQESLSGLKPKE